MELLRSPFLPVFEQFVDEVQSRCFVCSPYITAGPVDKLIESAAKRNLCASLQVRVLTDIGAANLVSGATDLDALLRLCHALPQTSICYLPKVHAKVYIADATLALVGSANFTHGGAFVNREYGVRTRDAETIHAIQRDMDAYSALGAAISEQTLSDLSAPVAQLRAVYKRRDEEPAFRDLTQQIQGKAEDTLIRARVQNRSENALFSETLVYVLQSGPLPTHALNVAVQEIHADLCDDQVDRVIDGVHYGKKWKHQVRGAQVTLLRQGKIVYDKPTKLWSLAAVPGEQS